MSFDTIYLYLVLIFTIGICDHSSFYTSLVVFCQMDNAHSDIVDANFETVFLVI